MSAVNDIKLVWHEFGADIRAESGDLLAEDDLTTAVVLSLFCDARARDDDNLPDGTSNKRGWWADTVAPMPATGLNQVEDSQHRDKLGSRLWLLAREKQLPEVLHRAKDYAEEALQWLITDNVATAVRVTPSIIRQGWLGLDIYITLPSGENTHLSFSYPYT